MLGTGIVAFITPAAGQLVWEDLQWGNRAQEPFPGHEGVRLTSSPAEMTSSLSPHLWLIGLRFHFRAETMHNWMWSSVTKRPGHLTTLLYWSTRRSHHWQNGTGPVKHQFSPALWFKLVFLVYFVCKIEFTYKRGIFLIYTAALDSRGQSGSFVEKCAAWGCSCPPFIHIKTSIHFNIWWTMVKVSQLCLRLQFLVKLWTELNKQWCQDWNSLLQHEGKLGSAVEKCLSGDALINCLNIYLLISDFILFYCCVHKAWPEIIRDFFAGWVIYSWLKQTIM